MAGIIPPLIRTQQPNQVPQIDRRGVAANLTAAFVSISGAPLVNAARPSQSLTTAGSPTFTFDSQLGQYIQLNGSSQYLRNTTFTQSGNTYPLTLSAWFYADALAAGNHTIIALTASGGTSVIFQLYTNGANLLSRQYNTSSQIVSATTLVTGKWYLATVVFESLSSRKLYLDGILQGTDTVTASAPSGINQIDIGASPWAGPGEYFKGRISALMVLNAALTDKQILALKSNPWQIFAPIQRQIFAAVAGGAGSQTLTPTLYGNTHTFYGPTLIPGAVTLTPSLYSNSPTFYSPTVSIAGGPQQLTASRVDNASVFYSPLLSPGAVTLAPSLYNHSQTFYSLTLSASKTLSAALFANSPTFYSPIVSLGSGPQVVAPGLFTNAQSYFTQMVAPGQVSLFPLRLTNSPAFYAATVSDGSTGIPDAATRYTVTAHGRPLSIVATPRSYQVIK